MRIIAHDEDSMTNLFFSEIHRIERIEQFLGLINWRNYSEIPFSIAKAELHQQVNLSEFGKPDVIIIVTNKEGQKHIVIVEVKLGEYLECCIANENGKFNNKFNSRLNNQLTLRYRAIQSLSSIKQFGFITESEHITDSPYSNDQIRRCKKPATRNLFKDIAQDTFQFYLVTLTSDNEPPFKEIVDKSHKFFPLFFNQHSGSVEDFPGLGSVSWKQCHRLFDGLDNHFTDSFKWHFKNSREDEEPLETPQQEYLFVKGRQIIKYDGKLCHLSCRGYSYSIRYFREGSFVEIDRGKNDKEKYLALKNQIEILEKAPAKPIVDTEYWRNYFSSIQEDNKQCW